MDNTGQDPRSLLCSMESLMEEMIAQQRMKVLNLARQIDPARNGEDLLSPIDFPALSSDPRFNFEDGLLAGLTSARIALRARIVVPAAEAEEKEKTQS